MKQSEERPSVTISARDIIFECPSCGKSLVVDAAAEGNIVDCPQCRINLIVPPRPVPAAPLPSASAASSAIASSTIDIQIDSKRLAELKERLAALANQLKDLQAQRTELHNRLASHINEINRDLVMMARIETSQQKLLGEWQKVTAQIGAMIGTGAGVENTSILGSNAGYGRTRVQFGA
jgi:septal ring factor EnvC (AmiA/AmiB activator)